jgi:hypothetical protein
VFLNVDDVNLQDFIPRKDLGKNKRKKKKKKVTILVISFVFLG